MNLLDPWFEAEFITETNASGHRHHGVDIQDADGVLFWCPCGYGKAEYPLVGARPHAALFSFANPRGRAAPLEGGSTYEGKPKRWTMSGTGLTDLTLTPSLLLPCWHGFLTLGKLLRA